MSNPAPRPPVPPRSASPRLLALALLTAGLLPLGACHSTDDARVLQVLNQRGFGRPTQDANRQYYVGIGDGLTISDKLHAEYNNLSEVVRMDGVITLPEVGELYVNGLSPDEVTEVVRKAYDLYVNDTSGLTARVTSYNSKRYYVSGLNPNKPRSVTFRGDTLLIDALITAGLDQTIVDTEDIRVIRGDPENPLVIRCNYDAITQEGRTRDNILIRENDIIYLTPSIIGYITYGVAKLTAPLQPIQQLITGFNNVLAIGDSFGQNTVGFGYGSKFNQGGNNNQNQFN
ncbi:MAG: polysaccharide biosynthesis/export family protein [Planctomycetota bacterium]